MNTPPLEASQVASETLTGPARVPGEQPDASTTTLISDLANQPWQDGYTLGKGINAVTGVLCGSALAPYTVVPAQYSDSRDEFSSVTSTSEVERLISGSASGSYNIGGLNLTASTEYLNQVKQSKLDMTILATSLVSFRDYDTIEHNGLQFSAEAKQLLDEGKLQEFRNLYGDYYLGGHKRMATFRAVYTISSDTEEALQEVKVAIGAKVPDMFTAEGVAAFKQATSNSHISISFSLDMQGMPPNAPGRPPVPAGVETMQQYQQWFLNNCVPVPDRGELFHYSQIDHRIPTTLPISPDIFVAVGQLYSETYLLRITLHSLPSTWQSTYASQVQKQVAQVNANAQNLVDDEPVLQVLSAQTTALLTDVDNLNHRYIFLQNIRKMQATEPPVSVAQGSTVRYGTSVYPNEAQDPLFVIKSATVSHAESWEMGHMEHDFSLPAGGPIVQWELKQNRSDNGVWWKNHQHNNVDFVLLNNSAEIRCRSDYDRGYDNTLTVWYVDKSLIPNYTPGKVTASAPEAE
ncbi:hypothetical protein [Hymenobacter cellulosivorans]|uniref:MACPF domain-containing protein n=1 Tax=Hymenobacter cellulosivorans TaxID=2932249 RepID=A0ABY4F3F5_9BACT|nr:hypothetical protein [Hymenobacter cellulosivorans]UOQ50761.1 hypothetical protein MUN80_13430 [Hymenobacter cellulosivorans]